MTLISRAMRDIQYSTNLTNEEIAKRVGYTRQHLSELVSQSSDKALEKLREKFWNRFGAELKIDLLLKDVTELKKQLSQVSP